MRSPRRELIGDDAMQKMQLSLSLSSAAALVYFVLAKLGFTVRRGAFFRLQTGCLLDVVCRVSG